MNYKSFLKLILFGFICAFLASSCTKEGPQGANGENGMNGENGVNGENGINGTDGTDGVDGNMSCLECHTQAGMDALEALYTFSGHKAANYVGYAGGRGDCARCHSHSGFMNFLTGLPGADPIDIDFPTRIDCETCHGNHRSLEDDIDAPLRAEGAVTAISDGTNLDFKSASNLCANCHQSRRDYTYYEALDSVKINDVMNVVPEGMVGINSSHAGPHHGPQANTLLGNGGYGASSVGTHSSAGCIACHMGEVEGSAGGHSFKPSVASCNTCHSGATDFNINGKRTEFDTRIHAIAEALVTTGALAKDADTGEYHPHVSIVTEAEFKGFWNYMMLYEDHSHGAHNPSYFATLLTAAENDLGL